MNKTIIFFLLLHAACAQASQHSGYRTPPRLSSPFPSTPPRNSFTSILSSTSGKTLENQTNRALSTAESPTITPPEFYYHRCVIPDKRQEVMTAFEDSMPRITRIANDPISRQLLLDTLHIHIIHLTVLLISSLGKIDLHEHEMQEFDTLWENIDGLTRSMVSYNPSKRQKKQVSDTFELICDEMNAFLEQDNPMNQISPNSEEINCRIELITQLYFAISDLPVTFEETI